MGSGPCGHCDCIKVNSSCCYCGHKYESPLREDGLPKEGYLRSQRDRIETLIRQNLALTDEVAYIKNKLLSVERDYYILVDKLSKNDCGDV
jgi:hypothetical protein